MSCQKNSKLIKVEGSVFFFSSENGIKTCLERRAPPVPSAPKAAPASVLLCPCILITTLLIFMRIGTQGGLQSVILSLFLSPRHLSLSLSLSRLNLFFFSPLPNSWRAADPCAAACARRAAALCVQGEGTHGCHGVGTGLPLWRGAAPAPGDEIEPCCSGGERACVRLRGCCALGAGTAEGRPGGCARARVCARVVCTAAGVHAHSHRSRHL